MLGTVANRLLGKPAPYTAALAPGFLLTYAWKAGGDGSTTWVPDADMRGPDGVPDSQIQSALAVIGIWLSQSVDEQALALSFSLSLSHSTFQIKNK